MIEECREFFAKYNVKSGKIVISADTYYAILKEFTELCFPCDNTQGFIAKLSFHDIEIVKGDSKGIIL